MVCEELVKVWEPLLVRCRRRGLRRFVLREGGASWEADGLVVRHEREGGVDLSFCLSLLLALKRDFKVPSPGLGVVSETVRLFPGEEVGDVWGEVQDGFCVEERDYLEGEGLRRVMIVCGVVGVIVTLIRVVQLLLNWGS